MAIDTAETAYRAIAELSEATGGIRDLPLPPGEFGRLSDAAKAGRAWLAAHPGEDRAFRLRHRLDVLRYAVMAAAGNDDPRERITYWQMVADAADDLVGIAREAEQAERDTLLAADRKRIAEAEHAARLLPRRADAAMVERISA